MGNEEFYLNNKLVSIQLCYMEEYDDYIWTNEYYKESFFHKKRKYKLKEYRWMEKEHHDSLLSFLYKDINDVTTFKTDDELLSYINPIGVHIYSIRHDKRLYRNPKIVFNYVNGDKRTYYFAKNSEAEKFYIKFKANYKENEYLVFE